MKILESTKINHELPNAHHYCDLCEKLVRLNDSYDCVVMDNDDDIGDMTLCEDCYYDIEEGKI